MSRRFRREIEDFACQQCGRLVQGDGFTNHCPHCLWSKHVDVYPGDRAENCGGLMAPVALSGNPPKARIMHRCETCGQEKWNRVSTQDSFEALLSLAERQARQA
jgi:Zn finger protein HypA/HybF involved in hydrogenase expression